MPGAPGTDDFPDAEHPRHLHRMQRPRPAERHQRIIARIEAALDRDGAHRAHHVGDHDTQNALRGFLHGEAEPPRRRPDGAPGRGGIERQFAARQPFFGQAAEREVGVGHRGLRAAAAVASRPGIGAGAARADLHQPVPVEPGDRAAPGADGVDIHHRLAHREAGDLPVEADPGVVVADQRDVGARAAHVEGDDVRPVRALRGVDRADRARRRGR